VLSTELMEIVFCRMNIWSPPLNHLKGTPQFKV
jgi:hypothetical protein